MNYANLCTFSLFAIRLQFIRNPHEISCHLCTDLLKIRFNTIIRLKLALKIKA